MIRLDLGNAPKTSMIQENCHRYKCLLQTCREACGFENSRLNSAETAWSA
jgi:hypothetical protein